MSLAKKGYKQTPEHTEKIAAFNRGKKHTTSVETRNKISASHLERKKLLGYVNSPETREKMRIAQTGKRLSETTKAKISEHNTGEKNHFWIDGRALEKYSADWTKALKEEIRKRDDYTCQDCGSIPSIIVHHIDHDKKNCGPDNLVTLCRKCHINIHMWSLTAEGVPKNLKV